MKYTDIFKVIIRRLRLIKINRNFLVYLIFLFVSAGFWFLITLKEEMVISQNYKLKIVGMPQNAIITDNIPDDIKVNCSGTGLTVLQHYMKDNDHQLEINFSEVVQPGGKILIDANTLQRAFLKKLPNNLKYLSTTPNKLETYFSNGLKKRVPVVFKGKIHTSESRYPCGIIFTPDSVDVYAPEHIYDDIKSVNTVAKRFEGLRDTVDCELDLDAPEGVKIEPAKVKAKICVDLFTDKTISVPIYSENTPHNKILRTFPVQVDVTFMVSSTRSNEITPEDFIIVVNYNATKKDEKKCKLIIRQAPDYVRNVRLSPEYVEYVIEQEN